MRPQNNLWGKQDHAHFTDEDNLENSQKLHFWDLNPLRFTLYYTAFHHN